MDHHSVDGCQMNPHHLLFGPPARPPERGDAGAGDQPSAAGEAHSHTVHVFDGGDAFDGHDDHAAASSLHQKLLYGHDKDPAMSINDGLSSLGSVEDGEWIGAEPPRTWCERCLPCWIPNNRTRMSTRHSLDHQHEMLFGPTNEHGRVDPERRRVKELLANNPDEFPALCRIPALSTFAYAALFCAVVAFLLLIPDDWLAQLTLGKGHFDGSVSASEMRWKVVAYASVPAISCGFTYFHIWLALWMMFYPIEFIGCWRIPDTNLGVPFGWQGIIPFKAVKMAQIATELMTSRLINMKNEFAKINPEVFASIMYPLIADEMEFHLNQVMRERKPDIWNRLPASIKQTIVTQSLERIGAVSRTMTMDMQSDIDNLLDMQVLVENFFKHDASLLNTLFIQNGYQELVFIRDNGALLGFIFGVLQMVIWIFWHPDKEEPLHITVQAMVVFPLFGLVLGLATNWISLLVIFSPVEKTKVCGVTLHGLFLQRQAEVSAVYARLVTTKVIPTKVMITALVTGETCEKGSARLDALFARHIEESVYAVLEDQHALVKYGRDMVMSAEDVTGIRDDMVQRLKKIVPSKLLEPPILEYLEGTIGLEQTMRERMEALPSRDFEQMLHPVFQEDEWKLIVVGGALGVVIGLLQALFIN